MFLSLLVISPIISYGYVKPTTDPTEIGVGARPIGMGGCYVGLADDVNCVFQNPAGLAGLKTWQVQSMTTRLINMIDYLSLAGTYNTENGTFGFGYVGANVSDSFITDMTVIEDRGIIIPVTTAESISYTSNVILLSYGTDCKKFTDISFLDKVSVGATLKLFTQGLSGGDIENGVMKGYDMDIAFLYKPQTWLSLGWNQVDILPDDIGRLADDAGNYHTLPTITKLGMAVKVLGDEKEALYAFSQPLIYLLDFDYYTTRSDVPLLMRTGVEWWPSSYLALRLGFDQDVVGAASSSGFGTETNMTMGVGVHYSGFKFDYAYHKFGPLTENETSYISLSYAAPLEFAAAPEEKPAPAPIKKDLIKLIAPTDKQTTYDTSITIRGQLADVTGVTGLTVNGNNVRFTPDGAFEGTYPLAPGKNKFTIKANGEDRVLSSSEIKILRMLSFADVPGTYWSKSQIESLATLGILGGYQDGTFKPEKGINRAELTAALVKSKGVSSAEKLDTGFKDVPRAHWASFYIKNGVNLGFVSGYPDGTFRPAKVLTRSEGITVFSRFAGLKEPDTILEGPFSDVPGRHWAAKSITAARTAGLLTYLNDKPFQPDRQFSRAEAAEILSKTSYGQARIAELKNFETY